MKIDQVILAEGATADLRGALALVGVNQRVIALPSLPFAFKQMLAITFASEMDAALPQTGLLSVTVTGPTGDTVFAVSSSIPIVPVPRKDAPGMGHIVLEVPFSGSAYGIYRVQVVWDAPGIERDVRETSLYVVEPAEATA